MDDGGISARYNVIKKKVEIALAGCAGTPDNLDNVTLSQQRPPQGPTSRQ